MKLAAVDVLCSEAPRPPTSSKQKMVGEDGLRVSCEVCVRWLNSIASTSSAVVAGVTFTSTTTWSTKTMSKSIKCPK